MSLMSTFKEQVSTSQAGSVKLKIAELNRIGTNLRLVDYSIHVFVDTRFHSPLHRLPRPLCSLSGINTLEKFMHFFFVH
jgi:hypothetical protein